jgi:hypothetical protein
MLSMSLLTHGCGGGGGSSTSNPDGSGSGDGGDDGGNPNSPPVFTAATSATTPENSIDTGFVATADDADGDSRPPAPADPVTLHRARARRAGMRPALKLRKIRLSEATATSGAPSGIP